MENKLETKADFLELFKQINQPTRQFLTPGKARIRYAHNGVAFGNEIGEIEGFSRVLWGAGPAVGELDPDWVADIVTGLTNGADPAHPEYWGVIHDRDQRMVEMPAMALTLLYQDQLIWRKLSKAAKKNLITWMQQILNHECADGNWQFFKVIVETVVKKLGYPINEADLAAALQKIENCYLDEGWYRDSSRGRQDYYNPYAFHYYGLIYSRLCPDEPRSRVYVERATTFAKDYLHFFDDEGSNLPFGRSTTYRFAVISFWSALVWSGNLPFSIEEIKGLIQRNLQWWLKKDIFDGNGLLSLGYGYSQLSVTEPYNSTLSPYWLNKLFLLLDLPEEHAFWQSPAGTMPQRESRHLSKHMKGIFQHDQGHTVMLNAGQAGPNFHVLTNEKYLKLAYSTAFGYSVPRSDQLKPEQAMDSMIGLQRCDTLINTSVEGQTKMIPGGFMVRNNIQEEALSEYLVASTWKPTTNSSIRTWQIPVGGWQVRVHRLELDSDYTVYETGFALPHPAVEHGTQQEQAGSSQIHGAAGFSGILDLLGQRPAAGTICWPNTNVMSWDTTYLPGLEAQYPAGIHWLVTAVRAHPNGDYAARDWQDHPVVTQLTDKAVIINYQGKEENHPLI